jgi:hypothetical protein
MAREFEVALAQFDDGPPRQVTLLGRSDDPRLVAIVQNFLAGRWPAVVRPRPTPPGVPRIGDRRPQRGQPK